MSPSCQKPTEEQWLHYKAQIRYWYLVEEMQLGKIVDQLINLGFTVTFRTLMADRINELHYKLNKKWKFRKNIDKDTWVKIDHRISKRKREGKDSEVIYCGKRLKPETVKKETDRHRDMSIFAQLVSRQPPSPQVPTDALISICTPPSLSIDVKEIEWPRTLPWLNFPAKELRALLPTHMKSQYNEEILPEALISFTCGGQNRLRINELGVSKLAAIIGMSIPESYPDEQLQRAQYLLSGSPEEKLYEYLSIVLYGLSNNSHDLNKKENWQAMMVILKASGLLEIKSYPKRLKSWTIEAFMEKLFLTAIKRLFNPDFDDVDSITVIKWLLNLGQNPNVAATTIWYRIEGCRSRSAVR
ncbi:hypothetical protein RRF57_004070 [Xylaria bambusicola]|uniref:Clr5 domain-containing protein n=1 Tax=Xylaria bambusicola TaxID=326684 RepID=A0AAN7YWT4_9PEZI